MIDKNFILAEIRRTAEANGGIPLGLERFETATAVRSRDWVGRFWARWGDAVREAGFEPNQLQGAFEEDFLLGKLAQLALELGRFPVRNELKLRRREDPSFPSWNVFSRFGRQQDLAAKLAGFCRTHPEAGLESVASVCDAIVEAGTPSQTPDVTAVPTLGTVYLLKSGKFYKIGFTNSPGRRERELDLQLPQQGKIVHSFQTDDPPGIEAYWHRRFAQKCVRNEWFALTAEDVAAFKRRKSFM